MGFDLSNLDCTFRVKKSLKPEPNTCELQIFNLAEETRRVLETATKLVLRLEAGYVDALAQLFLGEIRSAHSFRDGPDIVTEISTGDSEEEMYKARISFTVGPKVPSDTALRAIARALGVGEGNVGTVAAKLKAKGKAIFGPGTVIHGNAAIELDSFCKSADLEWSVQDGNLQILDRGKALESLDVFLTPDSGLIGSPTIDSKGVVACTALIQPDLVPGRMIRIQSLGVNGRFRIQEVEYVGDTSGTDWYANIHAKAPK